MTSTPAATSSEFDVVIVGAGISGMQMLHKARELGLTARVFEAGSDVGGTWDWTERFSAQPEILRYLSHVADRFDLRRDIQFDTRVAALIYDESASQWTVRTAAGDETTSRFVIMASGCLSSANVPKVAGLDTFAGQMYHTGRWPHHEVDFTGQRVGVIGTGSTGIQLIPVVAEQAADLYVFQRTAAYSLPAGNHPLDPAEQASIKADYPGFRARNNRMPSAGNSRFPANPASIFDARPDEREAAFEFRWARGGPGLLGSYGDIMVNKDANDIAAEFVREKIRQIVKDPDAAALLLPKQVLGCKRICLDTNYYETFNRPNVHLVDVAAAPIERLTPVGIRTAAAEYELDVIVFATGFDAMTGALLGIDIRGRGGLTLQHKWSAGPRTYLGLGVPGFPNLFTISGPGSPSVLTNMMVSIHQHVSWIGECMQYLADNEIASIEA